MSLAVIILASSWPVRGPGELLWAITGAIAAAVLVVSVDSVAAHALRMRRRSEPGRSWDGAMAAVSGLMQDEEEGSTRFSALLRDPKMREIVIDALINAGRANPDATKCLRGRTHDVEALSNWVTDTLSQKDAGRRAYACEVVAMTRMRSARGRMLATAGDTDSTVRIAACRALAVIDPETSVGVLLGILDAEGPWAGALLGDVLQRLPDAGVQALVHRANEWGASPALLRLLSTAPASGANDVLIDALHGPDGLERALRARSAEAIDASRPSSRAALTALLTDLEESTRLGAVRSLARAGDVDSLLVLYAAMSDASPVVRMAAADGIAQLPSGIVLLRRAQRVADPLVVEAAELALWRYDATHGATSSSATLPAISR